MHLTLIKGAGTGEDRNSAVAALRAQTAIRQAITAGYRCGKQVRIGSVNGQVIGYNLDVEGAFPGHRFPVMVATSYGVAKCSVAELILNQ